MTIEQRIKADRSVLEVNIVCLEIDITEEWLQRRTGRPSSYQGCIERRRDEQNSGLGIVHAGLYKLVVPDVY